MSAIGRYTVRVTEEDAKPSQLKCDSQTYAELSDRNIMHSIQARSAASLNTDNPFNDAVDESEESKRLYFHMQPNGFMDTDHERQQHLKNNAGDDSVFLAPTAETFEELHQTESRPAFTREGYIHDFIRRPVDEEKANIDRTSSRRDFYNN
jgi:hypothetical protein